MYKNIRVPPWDCLYVGYILCFPIAPLPNMDGVLQLAVIVLFIL